MPVTVEWIEQPHIAQMTYQGHLTLEEIVQAWEQVTVLYREQEKRPFCLLTAIIPDRQIPVGLLQLATHPAMSVLQFIDAACVVNVDHFLIGMLAEMLSNQPYAPTFHRFDNYAAGLQFLQQVVRIHGLGSGI